ncbi:hypothetical protein G3578_10665 [Brevibacillus sp. SYP-B805]|uniref:hypothetical protein n=1 Tax=Brevibacillus sp. SYP-B805 TaxID=1578199 RepID=UPI0013EBF3C3|nr:hypothetical protein [Brevibacillus sp. SYP-B805]NGQ95615.1 hypothetical protein [Brevibacillus sp. SYP-B805]
MRFGQKWLLFFIALALVFPCGIAGAAAASPKPEEGLYFGGSAPVYFAIDDILQHKDALIIFLDMTDFTHIYYVVGNEMASLDEIMRDRPLYPYDPSKLEPVYTRIADGSKMYIDRNGESPDSDAPDIAYIR